MDYVFSSSQFKYWYYKQYHINIIIIIIIKKINRLLCFHPLGGARHEVDRREGVRGCPSSLITARQAEVKRRLGAEDRRREEEVQAGEEGRRQLL